MQVLIDNQTVNIKVNEQGNMEEFLEEIQNFIHSQDDSKLVIDITVDGEKIFESQQEMNTIRLDKVSKVEIKTDTITSTVTRVLGEIQVELPKLSSAMTQISTSLQSGNREAALELFSQICSEWRKIIQFFDNISQILQLDFSKIKYGDKSIDQANEELLALLVDTKKAIENDDLVMLSDLIEYELAGKIEEEIKIVDVLIDHLK